MAVPIPAFDFVLIIALAEHPLFGWLAEHRCDGSCDRCFIINHCTFQGVTINLFSVIFEVVFTRAHSAKGITFIRINNRE